MAGEDLRREDNTSEYSLDELAKGLATGSFSRGQALRWMGRALLGGVLASHPWGSLRSSQTRPYRRRSGLPEWGNVQRAMLPGRSLMCRQRTQPTVPVPTRADRCGRAVRVRHRRGFRGRRYLHYHYRLPDRVNLPERYVRLRCRRYLCQ